MTVHWSWTVSFGQALTLLSMLAGFVWAGVKLATRNVVKRSMDELFAEFKATTAAEIAGIREGVQAAAAGIESCSNETDRRFRQLVEEMGGIRTDFLAEVRQIRTEFRDEDRQIREQMARLADHIRANASAEVIQTVLDHKSQQEGLK